MKDVLRNYKQIIKRRRSEDSDTESQPLMSSHSSISSSFGAIDHHQPDFYSSDVTTDSDQPTSKAAVISKEVTNSLTKYLKRPSYYYENHIQNAALDVFTNHDNYNNYNGYQNFLYPKLGTENSMTESGRDISDEKTDILNPAIPFMRSSSIHYTHSSLVTIFAIWNTIMGTSILTMAWGIEKSGLFPGIIINLAVAGLCLYTAYNILKINKAHGLLDQNTEVSDLCRLLIGPWAEIVAKIFSLIVLIGALIVYWILMSNFLYHSVHFIYGYFNFNDQITLSNATVICPFEAPKNVSLLSAFSDFSNLSKGAASEQKFDKVWDLYSTVPLFLGLLMFPLLNFRSATFFTKFNSLGTVSVLYIMAFVAIKSYGWGINIQDWGMELRIRGQFTALTGMLCLGYFIHNIIIQIVKNNECQENNGRDLTVAFGLVTFTYIFMGAVFYVAFPLAKSCIQDNLLNNFEKYDPMTIIARMLLLFQLLTVFPLIGYMLRMDILKNLNSFFPNRRLKEFSYPKVIFINVVVVIVCILFACFLPRIGTLLRYTGALSGMVYIFTLPSLLMLSSMKKHDTLTYSKMLLHGIIITLGIVNLICQFFVNE